MNKTVLIACPTVDGKVVTQFAISYAQTANSRVEGYLVESCFKKFDSMLPRARNDLFQFFLEKEYDYLFFIDSDQGWQPKDFWKLVRLSEKTGGVVAAPVRLKSDKVLYNVNCDYELDTSKTVCQVTGVGTGFMCISKEIALRFKDILPFNYSRNDKGELVGEDIYFCDLCNSIGIPVFIVPDTHVSHVDNMGKEFIANFKEWYRWEK